MKRIRKWLAFTIAFVMLVNTSYVQSLPVFATELQRQFLHYGLKEAFCFSLIVENLRNFHKSCEELQSGSALYAWAAFTYLQLKVFSGPSTIGVAKLVHAFVVYPPKKL